MTIVISVAARKGGVGKTTTAANLAAVLADSGARVLAVDADAQGHLALALGVEYTQYGAGFPGWLEGETLACSIIPAGGVDLLACDNRALLAEQRIDGAALVALAARFRREVAAYDYVCIDGAPRGALQDWSLAVADQVIVCASCNFLAAVAVHEALSLLPLAAALGCRPVPPAWVLPTMHDPRTRDSRLWLSRLQGEFGGQVLGAIPWRTAVGDSLAAGVPVVRFAPGSPAALAYVAVARLFEGVAV